MATPITIWVYGDIGDEVRSQPIVKQLAALPDSHVLVRVNSPGGSVSEGNAIFNALREHRGTVRVSIEGLAASAASYIAMAGDVVEMAENALLMIHDPFTGAGGNARDLRQSAEMLDKIATSMQRAYCAKSGLPAERVREIMIGETGFTADEAKEVGFVDAITAALDVAAHIDLSAFAPLPTHIHSRLREMTTVQTGGKSAVNQGGGDVDAKTSAIDAFKAKETERRHNIRATFSPFSGHDGMASLEARCVDDMSCSVAMAREQLLGKLGEGSEPLGGYASFDPPGASLGGYIGDVRSREDGFAAAARDGILMRYGLPLENPHPAAQDFRGASVRELAATCLSRAGKTVAHDGANSIIRAALTTSDFPALLENTAHKALIVGLESAGATTHRDTWTRRGTVADFKKASRVALSEAPDLKHVGEAGEIEYGAITDGGKEIIQAETYARIVSISRQALINDDLDQLTRVPKGLGLSAARTESDLVYRMLADNPTMRDGAALFGAEHGNVASAAAAITVDSLGLARAAMRKQRGVQGLSYLNVTPAYLLVGADRETEALQVLSELQPNQAANAVPDWIRQLSVVVDPRIDDFADGAWFLTGNPNVHDTFEVAFLDGRSAPSLEQAEDFDTLNMRWRVVFDLGVAALDWRALYRNGGA